MVVNLFAAPTCSNGEYKCDQNMVRLGVGAALLLALLVGSLGVVAGLQDGFLSTGPILSVFGCLGLLGVSIYMARLCGRTLRITDDGILISDKHGNQIGALHWVELASVTERRRMAQLALWDQSGTRRVLVDQQYEKFHLIRRRILAEYAKVFALKPLPIEFKHPSPLLLENLTLGLSAVGCAFLAWPGFRQGQLGFSVLFLSFAVASFIALLNLHPTMAGPSGLFGDELVLRTLFKTDKLNRSDVASVELKDIANRYGQEFSYIVLNTRERQQLKITSRFGSIPELYLTLQAWLTA